MDEERNKAAEKEYPCDKSWMTPDMLDLNAHKQVAFRKGAKWQKKQDEKVLSDKIAAAYQLGLADKEEQMLKEAVEVRVQTSPLNGPLGVSAYCCNFPSKHPFYHCKEGDKVRIIVIPNTDEK